MSEPMTMMAMAGFGLAGLSMLLFATLKGWQGWLELKRMELTGAGARQASEGGMAELIEVADLKERIRKLEKIAACVDL
jgi:hypothetical protein